jgi:hypothetical protein
MKKLLNKFAILGLMADVALFIVMFISPSKGLADTVIAFIIFLIIFGPLYLVTREKK